MRTDVKVRMLKFISLNLCTTLEDKKENGYLITVVEWQFRRTGRM